MPANSSQANASGGSESANRSRANSPGGSASANPSQASSPGSSAAAKSSRARSSGSSAPANSNPAGSAQGLAPQGASPAQAGAAKANSASSNFAAAGDVPERSFRDALRAHMTLDGVAASAGDPSTPDSGSSSAAASLRDRSDASWQRLIAAQTMGGTAAASKPVKGVPIADDEDAAANNAAALKDAVAMLAGGQPAISILPSRTAAAGVATTGGRSVGSSAAIGRSTTVPGGTVPVGAAVGMPAVTLADASDTAETADTQAAGPAATARSASSQAVVADGGADSFLPPSSSLASEATPAWVPMADPGSLAYAASGGPPTSADVAHVPLTGTSLVQSLGERLQVQIARGSENAVIRLDPPAMGSIEITIRHEAGAVQVHLSASNSDVLNQLQGIGDALRQDLVQRHQGTVSVQVSEDPRGGQGRQRQAGGDQDESEQALPAAADGEASTQFALA